MEARDKPAVTAIDLDLHLIDLSHACHHERHRMASEKRVAGEMQVGSIGTQLRASVEHSPKPPAAQDAQTWKQASLSIFCWIHSQKIRTIRNT